jgi:hypothetical protein
MLLCRVLVVTCLLAACDRSLKVGDHGAGNGAPGVYDGSVAGTCPATCSSPAGSFATSASDYELAAELIGVWRICDGAYGIFFAPSDVIGVELAPHPSAGPLVGDLYLLTQGPSGPVRGAGFDYQLMYSIDDGVLYCHPTYNSGFSVGMKYSPCPRQWHMDNGWSGDGHAGTLVPF